MSLTEEHEICNILINKYNCDVIINENIPFTLYNANDIGNILEFSNIRSIIRTFDDSEKIKILKKTQGGNQFLSYITYIGLTKLLLKSRKPKSIELSNLIGLDRKTKYYVSIETDIIKCIMTTFEGNNMKQQYNINSYYIDLYFPEHKLAIECDETHHNTSTNKLNDEIRTTNITKDLNCKFIRFNPYEKTFNLFILLNNIYNSINH